MNVEKMTIAQIRSVISETELEDYPELIQSMSSDPRKAVKNLLIQMQRVLDREADEEKRILQMLDVEQKMRKEGYHLICGIDEVGRGPLAGPVVAAAVIMPFNSKIHYINDSKKLSSKKREVLAEQIRNEALAWAVGVVGPEVIDQIGILEATKLAMNEAVDRLSVIPEHLLVDAVRLPSPYPVKAVIHGDALCYSIAAASIVAKVYRDAMMRQFHELYPHYGFPDNMGYGTAAHIEALKLHGPCPIHRKSFIGNFV